MTTQVMLVVERMYSNPREQMFRAWTDPDWLSHWFGPAGYHAPREKIVDERRLGGRHTHVIVSDTDPADRHEVESVYVEYFEPDVAVLRQRITGAKGVSETLVQELRIEFIKTGRSGTLLRIVQGPFDPDTAPDHSDGWESTLDKLSTFLDSVSATAGAR